MAGKVEERVVNSVLSLVQAKGEPLTLAEIHQEGSFSSEKIEAALQVLVTQEKIRCYFIPEAQISVFIASLEEADLTNKRQSRKQVTPQPTSVRCSTKLRKPFKSPLQACRSNFVTGDKASLFTEVKGLHSQLEKLSNDIKELSKDYSEEELQLHIQKLHEYNEIKDVGQLLIGKLAEMEGTTTKQMYKEFGLELQD